MLLARERVSVVEAVERLAGTQAQEAKPPFVGLWTRLEAFTRKDLHDALHDREVVRATMMRGTLHLTSARDYAALRMPPFEPLPEAAAAELAEEGEALLRFLEADARSFAVEFGTHDSNWPRSGS